MRKILYRSRPNERLVIGIIYLCAMVPVWGLVVIWALREAWRERSRYVVFHAAQALWSQAALLLVFTLYCVARLACNVLTELGETPQGFARTIDFASGLSDTAMVALAAAYGVGCLILAWLSLDGRDVRVPVISRRIRERQLL